MKYPGKELEIFDKATIWRKYIYALTKKFLSDGMLEIGAGLGSFTTSYFKNFHNITLTELDEHNIKMIHLIICSVFKVTSFSLHF